MYQRQGGPVFGGADPSGSSADQQTFSNFGFLKIVLCPLWNGWYSEESHAGVFWMKGPSMLLTISKRRPQSSWESGFMKISGAGYSSTDLEAFLCFPFSPLSICLSSSSIDQSGFRWTTVHCLSRTHLAKSSGGTLIGPMMIGLLILIVLASGKQAILFCIYLFISTSFQKRLEVAYKNA